MHESALLFSVDPVSYTKPYRSIAEQIQLLQGRGMLITDVAKAETCLHRIGYYRLSGYAYPFRHREIVRNQDGSESVRLYENFRPETDFSKVMELYVFDKRLRLLFLDAIERIEVGLRVEVALILGRRGPFAHRDPNTFNDYFSRPDEEMGEWPHVRFLERLDEAFDRSKEEFAIHFRNKYDSHLPIWMAIELWDFGTLASLLQGMQKKDLAELAGLYSLPRTGFLPSWATSINFIRNVCAHHGRLWNRPLVQQPSPGRINELQLFTHLAADTFAQRRLYAAAATLQYLMRFIHPGSSWSSRLRKLLETFPKSQHISVVQMGFPKNWHELDLWNQA